LTVPPTLLFTVTFPANTGFAWDFIERLYARIADRLLEHGVRTIVAYPAIGEPPRTLAGSAAVPVVLDTELHTRSARARLLEFVRRENVKVVYFTERPMYSLWYRSLRSAGVRRIIVHNHTSGSLSPPTGIRRASKRVVVNLPGVAADVIVGVCDFVVERYRAVSLIDPARIRRIWNGMDPVPTGAEDACPDIRTMLGLAPETPLIGCACRSDRAKGVHVLFDAFDRLWRTRDPRPVLAYIGNGPQFEELAALRDSLPGADDIHMLGYVPSAASILRTANVCAVPSFGEAFSLAVLEMMVRGRPVVATRVGGTPEAIEDGSSGILVPADDAEALENALARVLDSPALEESLGHAARDRSSRLFTADKQISEMLATFQDVFSARAQ
jgi:glycosyltransferase involved in cell wall biosynthesis